MSSLVTFEWPHVHQHASGDAATTTPPWEISLKVPNEIIWCSAHCVATRVVPTHEALIGILPTKIQLSRENAFSTRMLCLPAQERAKIKYFAVNDTPEVFR